MQKNSRQKINCDYLREEDLEKWERGKGREGKRWHFTFSPFMFPTYIFKICLNRSQ